MNDRLEKFLKSEQLTPAKFADIIGVQRSSISHLLSGRNKPSFDFIEKVLQHFPKINSEWLLLGKGEMYKQMIQTSLFSNFDTLETERKLASDNSVSALDSPVSDPEILSPRNPTNAEAKPDASNLDSLEAVSSLADKKVERIVVFYADGTFKSYRPSSD